MRWFWRLWPHRHNRTETGRGFVLDEIPMPFPTCRRCGR